MTVRELIAELQKHASDNPEVRVTWEGITCELTPEAVYVSAMHDGALLIDGDGCAYKDVFIRGRATRA